MKAVTFYLWNLESTPNLYRFVQPFLRFMVGLAFGEILSIWEESRACMQLQLQSSSSAKYPISVNAGECPLKDAEQNTQKKPVITLIFKLKALVICTKFDLSWQQRDILNLTSCCLSCHKNLGLDLENATSKLNKF